jgi:thiol-disulfide isomerase/thioredoxin
MKQKLMRCLAVLLLALLSASAEAAVMDDVPVMPAARFERLLAEASGKVVLINFFASWCPPCREELPGLMRLRTRYRPDQVVFVGLSVDQSMTDLKRFLAATPLNYPVYMADPRIAHAYGVRSIPHNTVYNKAGILVGNQPGLLEERDLRRILDILTRE